MIISKTLFNKDKSSKDKYFYLWSCTEKRQFYIVHHFIYHHLYVFFKNSTKIHMAFNYSNSYTFSNDAIL